MFSMILSSIFFTASTLNVDPYVVAAMAVQESSLNPMAVGSAGEIGLLQLKPQYFAESCKNSNYYTKSELKKVKSSLISKAKDKKTKDKISAMTCGFELFEPAVNLSIGTSRLAEMQKTCKHKNNNEYVICHNLGIKGASRIARPKEFSYYKKISKEYTRLKKNGIFNNYKIAQKTKPLMAYLAQFLKSAKNNNEVIAIRPEEHLNEVANNP